MGLSRTPITLKMQELEIYGVFYYKAFWSNSVGEDVQ